MSTLELVIGILLLVMALFLVVSILMQSGKSKKLSGTIAGGAETFFGKQKGQAIDKKLSRITNVISLIFVLLVLSLLLINARDTAEKSKPAGDDDIEFSLPDEDDFTDIEDSFDDAADDSVDENIGAGDYSEETPEE